MNDNLPLFETPEAAPTEDITPAYVLRARILKLRRSEQRREALANITNPATRATVKFYIADYFARLHHRPLPDFSSILREECA
jgi:hypothetical protein